MIERRTLGLAGFCWASSFKHVSAVLMMQKTQKKRKKKWRTVTVRRASNLRPSSSPKAAGIIKAASHSLTKELRCAFRGHLLSKNYIQGAKSETKLGIYFSLNFNCSHKEILRVNSCISVWFPDGNLFWFCFSSGKMPLQRKNKGEKCRSSHQSVITSELCRWKHKVSRIEVLLSLSRSPPLPYFDGGAKNCTDCDSPMKKRWNLCYQVGRGGFGGKWGEDRRNFQR